MRLDSSADHVKVARFGQAFLKQHGHPDRVVLENLRWDFIDPTGRIPLRGWVWDAAMGQRAFEVGPQLPARAACRLSDRFGRPRAGGGKRRSSLAPPTFTPTPPNWGAANYWIL
jgi:hypothetical protein